MSFISLRGWHWLPLATLGMLVSFLHRARTKAGCKDEARTQKIPNSGDHFELAGFSGSCREGFVFGDV